MFIVVALSMRPFGAPPSAMDDYIIENSQQETGANNAVSAVVFDYRGYDTLGEATILFTAVTAVAMLFRRRKDEAGD
ncbi:MAG: hypothetical protein E4G93_03725 [Dehalococcoidia bacterium]|nr:MAG: hypothetical protein E4G93_03725 [Dehalococcoidia bacterium]